MRMPRRRANTLAWQISICIAVLSTWQWGYDLHARFPSLVPDLLDPYFVSKPSEIFEHFLLLSCLKSKMGVFNGWFNGDFAKCMARNENNLWIATAITLKNTFFGFVIGVSSGFAAAASLGISLTHREHCQGVTFVTAHKQDHGEPDWAALAATGTTLAIYMGMTRIESLCHALLSALPASTPAAVVQWAGTAAERRWLGRLDHLAIDAVKEGLGSPAVILVGNAVGEAVNWVTHKESSAFAVAEQTSFNAWQDNAEAVAHAA